MDALRLPATDRPAAGTAAPSSHTQRDWRALVILLCCAAPLANVALAAGWRWSTAALALAWAGAVIRLARRLRAVS